MMIAQEPVVDATLSLETAMMWGAYIHEGLLGKEEQQVLDKWGQGHWELMYYSTQLTIPALWNYVKKIWDDKETDFPGCFEYDVVSSLGLFCAGHVLASGELPSEDAVAAEIKRLVDGFFAQANPEPRTRVTLLPIGAEVHIQDKRSEYFGFIGHVQRRLDSGDYEVAVLGARVTLSPEDLALNH